MGTVDAPDIVLQGKFFGTTKLAEIRGRIHDSWVRQSLAIRKPLSGTVSTIVEAAAKGNIKRDGHLSVKGLQAVDRATKRALDSSFKEISRNISSNVDLAVRRSVDMQTTALRDMGLPVPGSSALNVIRSKHVKAFGKEEFFGASFEQRLGRIRAKTESTVRNQVRRATPDMDTLGKRVDQSLTFTSNKSSRENRVRSPQPGGSSRRTLERLNNGESIRKANDASMDVLREAGVEFAYWRLNPAHKWENGKEICEVHASRTDQGTVDHVRKMGFDPKAIDFAGLYLIDRYPDLPHPYCRCQPEPFMPEAWFEQQGLRAVDSISRADLPEEKIACGCGSDAISRAMISTMNGFATELGFRSAVGRPIVFSEDVAELFGPEGVSHMLAHRVSRDPKKFKQARRAVTELVNKRVPEIEKRLDTTVKRMRKELGRIERDVILSSPTRATARANQLAAIRLEITTVQAELESLFAMQRAFSKDVPDIIQGMVAGSRATIKERALRLGLLPNEFKVAKAKGQARYWIEMSRERMNRFEDTIIDRTAKRKTKIANIKKGVGVTKTPKGAKSILGVDIPGYKRPPFELLDDQAIAVKLIEEQKGVIAHMAPGAGKTPTALSSVTSLAKAKKIKNAVLSSPASIRQQFAREMVFFGDDAATVTFVVPSNASVNRVREKMTKALAGSYAEAHPAIKKQKEMGELRELITKTGKQKRELARLEKRFARPAEQRKLAGIREAALEQAQKETDAKLTIIRKTDYQEALVVGKQPKTMITVMGHDDLAEMTELIRDNYDYIGIDEIHQMTRQSPTGGAFKAGQLQKLTGGRIKYKVGFTGTASKNNVGELWDISEWAQPGRLGSREEFEKAFELITVESATFNDSAVKTLRRLIDDYTWTTESPVSKKGIKLRSAFFPEDADLTVKDIRELRREVTLTDHQKKRAAQIERKFGQAKIRQRQLIKQNPSAIAEMRAELAELENQVVGLVEVPKSVAKRMNELKRLSNPESLRNSELFGVIHGEKGFGEQTAKIIEVRKTMKRLKREGRKTIIHLERIDSADEITKVLKKEGISVRTISGKINRNQFNDNVAAFNNGEFDVLIATRAGSTGLNLQKSSYTTIHFDIPQTFAELSQRDARNFRKGQQRAVDSFAIIQKDVFLETERLRRLQQKKRVLRAVDELSKLDITEGHTAFDQMNRIAAKKVNTPINETIARRGRDKARSILEKMCKDLEKFAEAA